MKESRIKESHGQGKQISIKEKRQDLGGNKIKKIGRRKKNWAIGNNFKKKRKKEKTRFGENKV